MNTPASPLARPRNAPDSDASLTEALRGCDKGDLTALRRLYDLTAPALLGALVQMLGDPDEAEAALADCYVRIWQQSGDFNPGRISPAVWLRSVIRHHVIDRLRSATAGTGEEETDAALRLMDAALQEQFPDASQRLMRLAYASVRSPAEIARALELPLRQVQSDLRRGVEAMQDSPEP